MVVASVEIFIFSVDPDSLFVEGDISNKVFVGLYIALESIEGHIIDEFYCIFLIINF